MRATMTTWRARVGRPLLAIAVLLAAGYYHQRTILCEDALERRRTAFSDRLALAVDEEASNRDVQRYCYTWVAR